MIFNYGHDYCGFMRAKYATLQFRDFFCHNDQNPHRATLHRATAEHREPEFFILRTSWFYALAEIYIYGVLNMVY